MSKNTILVPTDFSEVANHALEHAIQVAKTFDNNIAILHVTEQGFLGGIFNKNSYDELVKEAMQSKMQTLADKCAVAGISASIHVKSGKVYKMVTEVADELKCDSIIMGTHGASGIEAIMGSNASRVMNYANQPVVVVKEDCGTKASYKHIVFPVDLSAESKQKVQWAIHLAKYYKSTIHCVAFKYNDEFLVNQLNAQVAYIENKLKDNDVASNTKWLEGNVASGVLNYAEAINADLILIMTQQDKGFSEYLLGSEAQQIVNHSGSVPVMCINPKEMGFLMNYGA
ncbi:MAG: universal stress protein [Flavobacteriaceae bacterium]|nr:universal stress protein [Flavobacteriaceae bacterium]